jgi:hypothetical protein
MVDLLHDMGYLYAVLDVFTHRFLSHWRGGFENLVANIEQMQAMEEGGEGQWVMRIDGRDQQLYLDAK